MSETDKEFVERMAAVLKTGTRGSFEDFNRLFALARRGAEADAEIERLRAALREIAKVTRGWEPGVWSEEEGRKYFSGLFFSAQHVARAALGGSDG